MINTRMITSKIKYILLFSLFLLIIWQIHNNYSYYETNFKITGNQKDEDILESLRVVTNKSRVVVSVYYEALCPDSRGFFVSHLLPTYLKMRSSLNIELIPYGKATTKKIDDEHFTIECQHGNIECFANKIHACSIYYIEDFTLLLKFITCMIDKFDDSEYGGSQCAKKFSVQWKPILNCANGVQGDWLLKKHGEVTNDLNPGISFVPTVLLNQNHHSQVNILKNLHKELCSNYKNLLTKECGDTK